jgi:hypothetical protein
MNFRTESLFKRVASTYKGSTTLCFFVHQLSGTLRTAASSAASFAMITLSLKRSTPPGTRVDCIDPISNMLISDMLMDTSFPVNVSDSSNEAHDLPCTIFFDDGTTASIPLSQMASLIPPPLVTPSTVQDVNSLLPPILHLNSCITYENKGQYHKGYLGQQDEFIISCSSHT